VWVPPERRLLGVVFQDARLFPHMSVDGNLRYGQRRAKAEPGGADPIGFDEVVALLGLGAMLARRPHTLSGGERQRVAIGRALLARPRLLLMDEPLASLDGARKAEILPYLARLKASLTLPIVYVTHSLDEVARLADTLVLIEGGRCVAAGPLGEIAARADLPLAARDDAAAVLSATVAGHDRARRLTLLAMGGTRLLVPLREAAIGAALRVRVPARDVMLATQAPHGISVQNALAGTVRRIVAVDGEAALVEVALDGAILLARVTPDAVARLGLAEGSAVIALVKSMSVEVL
jgi:molybdate transport system ATP-binding protein